MVPRVIKVPDVEIIYPNGLVNICGLVSLKLTNIINDGGRGLL